MNLRSADCLIDTNFELGSLVCILGLYSVKISAKDLHDDMGEVLIKLRAEAKWRQNDSVKY